MYCKQCGQIIDDNSRFCKYCGANQGLLTTIGILNQVTGRSGVIEVDTSTSLNDFISELILRGWIPNDSRTINTLEVYVKNEIIYDKGQILSKNNGSIVEILEEMDSDDVSIVYEEFRREIYIPRRETFNPFNSGVCLYGCPNSKEVVEEFEDEESIESSIF